MPDDLTKKKPKDASRVNTQENWEIEYWCKKFGCTKTRLSNAVNAVGTSVAAVANYLKR